MFSPKEPSDLDREIDRAYRALADHDVGSEEYETALNVVTKLNQLKSENRKSEVSKDAMLSVGANLLGILLIINFERTGIVTSKAMSLIGKNKTP